MPEQSEISDLMKEMNRLIESQTFTAAAATGIAQLRAHVEKADKDLAYAKAQIEDYKRTVSRDDITKQELQEKIAQHEARVRAIEEREKKMIELEMKASVAEAVGKAYNDINQRILANRIMRENIHHSQQIPVAVQGAGGSSGWVSTHSQTETKDRIVEDQK